jgi:hypothetical protein
VQGDFLKYFRKAGDEESTTVSHPRKSLKLQASKEHHMSAASLHMTPVVLSQTWELPRPHLQSRDQQNESSLPFNKRAQGRVSRGKYKTCTILARTENVA